MQTRTHTAPRRRTLDAFSLTERVGFLDLEARITPHLATGLRSRAFGDGGLHGAWAPATLRSAWSTMRSALVAAMQESLPSDERSPTRAEYALRTGDGGADVRAFLHTLPHVAAGLRKPGASAANAANQVRMLRRALVSGCTDRSPVAVKSAVLPAPWSAFVARVAAHRPRVGNSVMGGVFKLSEAASTLGVSDPTALPTDGRAMTDWLRAAFRDDKHYYEVRGAITRLTKLAIPDLGITVRPARRSIAIRLDTDAALHASATEAETPALAKFARVWNSIAARGQTPCADTTVVKLRLSFQRFNTYAVLASRAGLLPPGLATTTTILDWWNEELPVALNAAVHERASIGPQEGDEDLTTSSSMNADTPLTVLTAQPATTNAVAGILAWAARNGHMPKAQVHDDGDLPRSVLAELEAVWRMTTHWMTDAQARVTVSPSTLIAYQSARAAYLRARDSLSAGTGNGDDELTSKDKAEAAKMLSLPLLIAVVLPYWTMILLPRLQARIEGITQRLEVLRIGSPTATHWPLGTHRDEIIARQALTDSIREWFVFAAFIADPLRIKNFWAARVGLTGTEVVLECTFTPDGRIGTITRITSRFGGAAFAAQSGNAEAVLKTRAYGSRLWDWPQVVVDHTWAARYFNDVWFPSLRRAGVLPDGATVRSALTEMRYALIATDGGTQRFSDEAHTRRHRGAVARYAGSDSVRKLFRRALLTGLRALGDSGCRLTGQGIPHNDDEAARQWPWLLAPHVVRLWWVTYMLGVLSKNGLWLRHAVPGTKDRQLVNPVDFAQRATTDTPKTMSDDYDACSEWMRQQTLRTVRDWTHPRAYADVVDYLVMPDRRPDFHALWQAWSRGGEHEGLGMLPPEFVRAYADRQRSTDLGLPQIRRRAVTNRPPVRGRRSSRPVNK